ncbi:organic cation transporter protein-like [Glandiceps talaboti]
MLGYNLSRGFNVTALLNVSLEDQGEDHVSISCSKWTYDKSQYTSTTVTEWNLVCGSKWLRQLALSMLYTGFLIGSLTFGAISDRYGRLVAIYSALFLQSIFGFLSALSPNFVVFVMCQFVVGFSNPGVVFTAYAYVIEWTAPSKRAFIGNMLAVAFAIGHMTTALLAFLIRDWRLLQAAISIPPAVLLILCPLRVLPESPRWLLSHGHVNEMDVIIRRAALENETFLPNSYFYDLQSSKILSLSKLKQHKRSNRKHGILDLCRWPKLRLATINIMYGWLAITVAYYGLSLLSTSLAGNEYLNFFLSGLVEVPAIVAPIYVLNRWGRKKPIAILFIMCAVACFFYPIPPKKFRYLVTPVMMIGKFSAAAAFWSIAIYTSEIYPTVVRNIGIGVSSAAGRIGSMILPYTFLLADIWGPLPYIIMGFLVCTAGISLLFLPETLHRNLPASIMEFEETNWKTSEVRKESITTWATNEKYLVENIVLKLDFDPDSITSSV